LAGTLAAKSAVRADGYEAPWGETPILRDSDRAPVPIEGRRPSISHAANVAIAAVGHEGRVRVGIDVERVEYRSPSFLREAFTSDEIAALPSGPGREVAVALSWSVKEAVLKALGTGLSLDLHSVRVTLTDGVPSVDLANGAKTKFNELGGNSLDVAVHQEGTTVYAIARLGVGPDGAA